MIRYILFALLIAMTACHKKAVKTEPKKEVSGSAAAEKPVENWEEEAKKVATNEQYPNLIAVVEGRMKYIVAEDPQLQFTLKHIPGASNGSNFTIESSNEQKYFLCANATYNGKPAKVAIGLAPAVKGLMFDHSVAPWFVCTGNGCEGCGFNFGTVGDILGCSCGDGVRCEFKKK